MHFENLAQQKIKIKTYLAQKKSPLVKDKDAIQRTLTAGGVQIAQNQTHVIALEKIKHVKLGS